MKSKISVTVDTDALHEAQRLAPGVALSNIINEALRNNVAQLRLAALLRDMERENPIDAKSRKAGEALWNRLASS